MRNHLVPIVPTIERLGRSRHQSSRAAAAGEGGRGGGGGTKCPPPLEGHRPRPQTNAAASRRHGKDNCAVNENSTPLPSQRGPLPLGQPEAKEEGEGESRWPVKKRDRKNRMGARTAGPPLKADRRSSRLGNSRGGDAGSGSKRHAVAGTSDTWPGLLRQVVPSGAEAIAGLPLSGDERDEFVGKSALAAAAYSRSSAQIVDSNKHAQRRPPGVLPGATSTGATSVLVREKTGNQAHAPSALPPPLASIAGATEPRVGGAGLSAPHQEEPPPRSQQWGGFGPGHVPKYFRGKFGVAGERKMLVRRQSGDTAEDDGIRELIAV